MQPHVVKKQHHLQQQESSTQKKSIIVYTYNKKKCQVGTDIKKNVLVQPENGHGYTMSVLRSYVITTISKTDITTVQHYP